MFATWVEVDQRWAFGIAGPDHIEITSKQFRELLDSQSRGMCIGRGTDGLPLTVDPSVRSVEQIYSDQKALINKACEAGIVGGFASAALGAVHQYSSQFDDQMNLTLAVLSDIDMPYACTDEQGVRVLRLHTADQLRQVGEDFTRFKLQLLQRADALKAQLDLAFAAADIDALEAITWEGSPS